MREGDSPRIFRYSDRAGAQRRNLAIIFAFFLVWHLTIVWPIDDPHDFLVPVLMLFLALGSLMSSRGNAAEVYIDGVRLPNRFGWRLLSVRFNEIIRLEKILDRILVVVYSRHGKTRKARVDLSIVQASEVLERLLIEKTGLSAQIATPWWVRISRWSGGPVDLGEKGAWKKVVLYPELRILASGILALIATILFFLVLAILGQTPPLWSVLLVSLGTYFLVYRWLLRRSDKTRSK